MLDPLIIYLFLLYASPASLNNFQWYSSVKNSDRLGELTFYFIFRCLPDAGGEYNLFNFRILFACLLQAGLVIRQLAGHGYFLLA
jgi:hypothetical protein